MTKKIKIIILLVTTLGAKGAVASSAAKYTHQVPVSYYIVDGSSTNTQNLINNFKIAQDTFSSCGIKLLINKVNRVNNAKILDTNDLEIKNPNIMFKNISFDTLILKEDTPQAKIPVVSIFENPNDMLHWETLLLEDFKITPWEKNFFSKIPNNSFNVLFVDSFDWSADSNGLSGLGYAAFNSNKLLSKEEVAFYNKAILGNAVITKYKKKYSLAHELGHAIFNLKHHPSPNNIMMRNRLKYDNNLNSEQCQTAVSNLPKSTQADPTQTCRVFLIDKQEQPDDKISSIKICFKEKKATQIIINNLLVYSDFIEKTQFWNTSLDTEDFFINFDTDTDLAIIYFNKTEQAYFLEEKTK